MASAPITIEQRIAAGNQFDGNAHSDANPTTDQSAGIQKFAAGTAGGLFVFALSALWAAEVQRIMGDFADATTVQISIRNAAGDDVLIFDGSGTPGDVLITDRIILAPDEQIRIVTTGATQAMVARVMMRPSVARPPT